MPKSYNCKVCDYYTFSEVNFTKHNKSEKHIKNAKGTPRPKNNISPDGEKIDTYEKVIEYHNKYIETFINDLSNKNNNSYINDIILIKYINGHKKDMKMFIDNTDYRVLYCDHVQSNRKNKRYNYPATIIMADDM